MDENPATEFWEHIEALKKQESRDGLPEKFFPLRQKLGQKAKQAASGLFNRRLDGRWRSTLTASASFCWRGTVPRNCLRMPEARAFRRAGCGKSARPVRRGEDEPRAWLRSPSYSTGSVTEPRALASGQTLPVESPEHEVLGHLCQAGRKRN